MSGEASETCDPQLQADIRLFLHHSGSQTFVLYIRNGKKEESTSAYSLCCHSCSVVAQWFSTSPRALGIPLALTLSCIKVNCSSLPSKAVCSSV